MDLNQAIDKLKHLPIDLQRQVIEVIESVPQTPTHGSTALTPFAWAESLLSNPLDTEHTHMSENPTLFVGRDIPE